MGLPVRIMPVVLLLSVAFITSASGQESLLVNSHLLPAEMDSGKPEGFEVTGDAWYRRLDDFGEQAGWGIRFFSNADIDQNDRFAASVSARVTGIKPEQGRWFRLQFRGRAEDGFHVEKEDLYLKVEFFKDGGKSSLDSIRKTVFAQVQKYRADLADEGTNESLGGSTWNLYFLEFRTPFREIDTLEVSIGFDHGAGRGEKSEFLISEIELQRISAPTSFSIPRQPSISREDGVRDMVPIGGRWYFDPGDGPRDLPERFTQANADRLIYLADRPTAPFAGNMSAWLRKGYLDREGNTVPEDRFVEESQVITVEPGFLVIRSRNLPNHPTAEFPDRWRSLDGNPNYIQEQNDVWRLPLEPRENPNRLAMQDGTNLNGALPGGPIGVAVNGVVFFNPFDHLMNEDAVWRLDRCCGHPSPFSQYHYHKYPVCVKTPWVDDGGGHSPVIGFAFDGYPVYGPYESEGVLARDVKQNALNEFNVHQDDVRGWHYHVTPGKFPHLIGGFWGMVERRSGPRGFPPPGLRRGNRPPRS